MSSELSSQLATHFDPVVWDPIINAITSVLGPFAHLGARLSALTSSVVGLI